MFPTISSARVHNKGHRVHGCNLLGGSLHHPSLEMLVREISADESPPATTVASAPVQHVPVVEKHSFAWPEHQMQLQRRPVQLSIEGI